MKLYRNRHDGTFEDVTNQVGLDKVYMPMGANFGDIDNDGYLDVYLGMGAPSYTSMFPHVLLRNDQGKSFVRRNGIFRHRRIAHRDMLSCSPISPGMEAKTLWLRSAALFQATSTPNARLCESRQSQQLVECSAGRRQRPIARLWALRFTSPYAMAILLHVRSTGRSARPVPSAPIRSSRILVWALARPT